MPGDIHYILFGMHHIILDAYSFSIMFRELEEAYTRGFLAAQPTASQYRFFANEERPLCASGALTGAMEYYRTLLPAAADIQPLKLLPYAKITRRRTLTVYKRNEAKIRIPSDLASRVRQLARGSKSTSFHVYLAAMQLLLFQHLPSAQELVIGIADANRSDKQFMNSIGFFLNLLPLRFVRDDNHTSVASVTQKARDKAHVALAHSQLPFDVLLRELKVPRSSKHTPLFQVFVDYRQVPRERSSWCGCKVESEAWHAAETGYDIALEVTESA